MPYADPQKRRKASRESQRRRRARERENVAERLPAAPSPVDSLAAFIETLVIGQGDRAGEAFELLDWERQFLAGAFAPGIDSSALTLGRGNGKSSIVAAIAAAAVVGPLAVHRGECIAVASSFSQARIIFEHARSYLRPWIDADPLRYRVLDSQSAARIEDRQTGAVLRCIGSDSKRAHGLAPALILCDEPAQWPVNYSAAMFAALETAKGKLSGARLIALGTRPKSGLSWFAKLLEGGPGVYAQAHVAPANASLDDPAAWEQANPSLSAFPALYAALRIEASRAVADPALAASFKALRLNQGVADTEAATLIDADSWKRCETDALPPRRGTMVLGVDLGGASAMTGAAAYWPHTGRLEAAAWFPDTPSLSERGLRDGVGGLYGDLHQRGELLTTRGRTVPVADVLSWCMEHWGRPSLLVGDRYKSAELLQAADDASLLGGVVFRGMGYRDGGQDVSLFRRAVLDGRVKTPPSVLVFTALEEAVVVLDGAGNSKLAKGHEGGRRIRHRDDVVAAAILAVAEGTRRGDRKPRKLRWAVAG